MIKHSRKYSAGTTSRSSDDNPSRSVFLTYRQRVSKNQSSGTKRFFISHRLNIIRRRFPLKIQCSRKCTLRFQSPLDCCFHSFPHFAQIIPDRRAFTLLHIFPVILSGTLTPRINLSHGVHIVKFGRHFF